LQVHTVFSKSTDLELSKIGGTSIC